MPEYNSWFDAGFIEASRRVGYELTPMSKADPRKQMLLTFSSTAQCPVSNLLAECIASTQNW